MHNVAKMKILGSYRSRDSKVTPREKIKKYLTKVVICVDPKSRKLYLNNIKTGKIIVLNPKGVPRVIKERINREIELIDDLIKEKNLVKYKVNTEEEIKEIGRDVEYEYDTKTEYDAYRRRKLPRYLLNIDRTDYPRYASKDDISIAYLVRSLEAVEDEDGMAKNQVTTTIRTRVHCTEYKDLIQSQNPSAAGGRGKRTNSSHDLAFEIDLTLINSVNECIKKILRKAYHSLYYVLEKKDKTKCWALRLYNFEEYMYGDIPLINYYSVQKRIRGYEDLEVLLVEIPVNATNYKHFPPISDVPHVSEKIKEKHWFELYCFILVMVLLKGMSSSMDEILGWIDFSDL